jgi:hypothetical protein
MTKAFFGSNGKHEFVIETPDWLIDEVIAEFGEFYDPCPVNPKECGLAADWNERKAMSGKDCVYVNPPYTRGSIKQWVEKCYAEHLAGVGPIVLLIPSYTDTAYFHDCIYQKPNVEVRFFRGRIQFKGYKDSRASFPSMLVIFGSASRCSLDEGQEPSRNSFTSPDLLAVANHRNQSSLIDFMEMND